MNRILQRTSALLLAAGTMGGTMTVHAGHRDRVEPPGHAYGKVIQVKPLYETVRVAVPDQRCWKVHDRHRPDERGDEALAGAVIGGIIGGIAGNQFGHGDGRTVTTIAGTVLGAVVGHQIGGNLADDGHHGWGESRRCEPVGHVENREELVGYRVKYRYKGHVYHSETDYHPGERIRVDNRLRPIHF